MDGDDDETARTARPRPPARAHRPDKSRTARRRELDALQRSLGREFDRPELLEEALTHASASTRARPSNERLEFLGDRVLGLMTAEALCDRFPHAPEGELAPRLNALVRKETCAEIAEEIGLGAILRVSRSEAATGGRRKQALLGDAMEAVIAAIYLDGGLDAARDVFRRLWSARLDRQPEAPIDAKTALQEWAQARGEALPRYALIARDGPDHAPRFTVSVTLDGGAAAEGVGASKRAAEQLAAAAMLDRVGAARNGDAT